MERKVKGTFANAMVFKEPGNPIPFCATALEEVATLADGISDSNKSVMSWDKTVDSPLESSKDSQKKFCYPMRSPSTRIGRP